MENRMYWDLSLLFTWSLLSREQTKLVLLIIQSQKLVARVDADRLQLSVTESEKNLETMKQVAISHHDNY